MKAKLEVMIRDEHGHLLSQLAPYDVELAHPTLHEIEGVVEEWRKQALPDIESQLLSEAQAEFSHQVKKQPSGS